ncbi:YebC/PmpR family DNA-binding transcriptional regulator [Proteiniclasticum sp. BAD-10]|uniref:Probable transcriptional regulatory protein KCG48_03355 n=1 Tax=Proteiniclasticum sediminis TaxID=2804028 RepID=A0A941CMF5_9CLOT|nr:YebC/PmpR family DNA-binding transcriptional regulator [Proteiniclasticum sediminis]MBR0575371.1 YebC/PmpR family DNA-binding transcriptional regulator [Proteiniclasticum sediminis]
MSGHSKWHNIQAKKNKMDAKRGKIFTKIGKELMMAAKDGANPDTNSKLRDVITKAKAANMPMDNINRVIKKAAGETGGADFEEMVYEGYGPNGVAVIVEAYTDNKNRTAGNVRHIFDKFGGNLGTTGSVTFMFNKKGQLVVEKTEDVSEEELMMVALDSGAEDFLSEDTVFEIITEPETFETVKAAINDAGFEILEGSVTMLPNVTTSLDLEMSEKFQKLVDKLLEDDDVDNVYHNADFDENFEEN